MNSWFRLYLTNREQFVEISSVKSEWIVRTRSTTKTCRFGVPQGSILGPILFLCYLNGMPKAMSSLPIGNMCLYADDTNLKISGKSVEQIEIDSYIEL